MNKAQKEYTEAFFKSRAGIFTTASISLQELKLFAGQYGVINPEPDPELYKILFSSTSMEKDEEVTNNLTLDEAKLFLTDKMQKMAWYLITECRYTEDFLRWTATDGVRKQYTIYKM